MIDQKVCIYNKFGYCKSKNECKFFHPEDICENLQCDVSNCMLRHPMPCKFLLHYGKCKFDSNCKFDHRRHSDMHIELNERMKTLENMCSILKSRCDKVNKECRELRESIQSKEIEVEKSAADIHKLKERNIALETELQELHVLSKKHKRKVSDNDSLGNKKSSKELKVDGDKVDDSEIVKHVIKIKKFVFRERMTKKNVLDCNLKIQNLSENVRSNFLQKNLERMMVVLKNTNLTNYKKIAVNELEKFKNICIEENKKENDKKINQIS